MRQFSLMCVALACCACARSSAVQSDTAQRSALRTDLPYGDRGGIRFGCLPRAGDSTHFEIEVIVDSLREKTGAGLAVMRGERAAPRAYRSVTVEIQRSGQARLSGTSCWHDAGIVVRGSEAALKELSIFLDAPGSVLIRIVDGRGRSLGEGVWSTRQSTTEQIRWNFAR